MCKALLNTKQPKASSIFSEILPIFIVSTTLLLGAITLIAIQQDTIIKLREQTIIQHCAEYDNYTGKFLWTPKTQRKNNVQ